MQTLNKQATPPPSPPLKDASISPPLKGGPGGVSTFDLLNRALRRPRANSRYSLLDLHKAMDLAG